MRKAWLLVVGMMLMSLLPIGPAMAADPKITFLNPSGYSTTMTISDKPDRDSLVHLVAWVQAVPANPLVEFEIQPAVGNAITLDGERASDDTWEAFAGVSGLTDGTYTLRAILYSNLTEAASTTQDVSLTRNDPVPPPAADTVELTYPPNATSLGFSNITGKRPAALLEAVVSDGTDQVRALYTTTAPGLAPNWISCGAEAVPSTGQNVTVRCTLAENTAFQSVTAVAVVANNTPVPSDPSPFADATGDAHRVSPYSQVPTSVSVTPETVRVDPGACVLLTARVRDQSGRSIAAANVDVHVVGPNDQIRFGTIQRTTSPTASQLTSGFQAPDKSHVSSQDGIDCGNEERAGRQGDHNIPGANDPQHIESTTGSDDEGKFFFALFSDSSGGSVVTTFVDNDDDDVLDANEATGGARIGWGQDAPAPTTELFFDPRSSAGTSGDCQRIVLAVKRAGNALPNVNVDIHASGPDSTIAFCTPSDGTIGRAPDQNHVGNADDETTRHVEGETNTAGQFIFGVVSGSGGTTNLLGWLDELDDDIQTAGEPIANASVQWDISGARTISIRSNKSSVPAGHKVNISGSIDGAGACESEQKVRLMARRLNATRFQRVTSTVTDASGDYLFQVLVKRSKKYKTVAPAAEVCDVARSRAITVRAT
jgi:hypothetical protein